MHTTVSDGTDVPEEIVLLVREKEIQYFSITDHDAIHSAQNWPFVAGEDIPAFIPGVEFSCKDELGKYHILGFGYDPKGESINRLVEKGHALRVQKMKDRLQKLKEEYQVVLPEKEIEDLLHLNNPGKPHLAAMLVKYGYAPNKRMAFDVLNQVHTKSAYVRPEEAIEGILASGGIPVLAHPLFGSGDEHIEGVELEKRIDRLVGMGLRGLEAFYSGFSSEQTEELLALADRYDLYVTAGSDYHGSNKKVQLGDTGVLDPNSLPERLVRFLEDVKKF